MPLTEIAPEYSESVKSFETPNDLAKAYHELNTKISSGDISILPEDIRKDPTVAKYKTVSDLAKGHVEATKLVGSIKKAPETPDGYKFTPMAGLHKGLANVVETQKALGTMFHKAGLHGEQADMLQQQILNSLSTGLQKNDEFKAQRGQQVETELRKEWGENYDKNLGNVVNILKRCGAEDLANNIGGDAISLKAISKITSLLSEDSVGKLGSSTNTGSPSTKDGALQALKEFNKQVQLQGQKHPWLDKKNPDNEKVTEEYNKLFEVAYGN